MKKKTVASFLPLLVAVVVPPATAQAQGRIATPEDCAALPGADAELDCLRRALAASQEALRESRAEESLPQAPGSNPSREPVAAAAGSKPGEMLRSPELGSEQVAARAEGSNEKPAERIDSVISAFRTDRRGLLIMKLANGQIWRQVEDVDLPLSLDENERAAVQIARSGFGGYRMSFPDKGKRIAVARVQ